MSEQEIIGQIADIRASNNRLWMKLLELALRYAPDEARKTLKSINGNDKKIGALLERLAR